MRYGIALWWAALGTAAGLVAAVLLVGLAPSDPSVAWAAERGQEKEKKPGGPPPLVVSKDAPLLLLEEPPKPKARTSKWQGPKADNRACYCCHANYEEESMVLSHADENVGCVKCHGESLAHRNDEDNITPPDIIFPAEEIDRACRKCHEEHVASAVDVIVRWQKCCPAKTNPAEIVCTDCHGEHRLHVRTVRWDKKTRKLILAQPQRHSVTGAAMQ